MSSTPPGPSLAPPPSPDAALDLVRSVVASFLDLPPELVDDGADLAAHGADSIDRVEILTTLKRRLGLDVPLAAFARVPHLRALAELLAERAGGTR